MGVLESRPYMIGISIILILASSLVLLAISPPWSNPGSATAIYSVLAFLTITITTCAMNVKRTDPIPSHDFFIAGTGYSSIIFAGAAIFYVFTNETAAIHVTTSGIFLNLVAFATTGVTMFLYSYYGRIIPSEFSRWNSRTLTIGIMAIGSLIFVIFMIISRLSVPSIVFLISGYVAGVLAIITYVCAAVLTYQQKNPSTHDSRRLTISFVLLSAASLNHMLILPAPTAQWLVSIVLMGIAFIIAIVAVGFPFLEQIGIRKDLSYAIAVGTSTLVILPFILTYLVETTFSFVVLIDVGATVLIHLGGMLFALALAYALYTKSKNHPTPYHSPVILLLVYWTVAEASLAFTAVLSNQLIFESLIPYVFGGVASIVFLTISVRRMLNPGNRSECYSSRVYIVAGAAYTIVIYFGGILYLELQPIIAVIPELTMNRGLLLGLTFLSLYALGTFLLLQTGIFGGDFSFDTLSTGATAIWLIVMALKANFSTWSSGWWTAESLMALCIVLFPLLLMRMYLKESMNAISYRERATTYSEYLSDKIRTHGTQAIDSLGALDSDSGISESSRDSLSSALQDLSNLDDIAKNLATVLSAERFSEDEIEPTDLIGSIQIGLRKISNKDQEVPVVLDGNMNPGECFVSANPLLSDAFYHLFVGAIRRIGVLHSILIEVSPENKQPKSHWYCTVNLELSPAELVEEHHLFSRYTSGMHWKVFEFAYAQRIVTLFGGYIQSGSTTSSGTRFSVHFELILPAAIQGTQEP